MVLLLNISYDQYADVPGQGVEHFQGRKLRTLGLKYSN